MEHKIEEQWRRYNYILMETDAAYHDMAVKLGLSDSAMRILYILCINEDSCLLNDIARYSCMSKQTVHSSLHKLVGEGLLELQAVDGKKKSVRLTEKGSAFCEGSVRRIIALENTVINRWTEEERQIYLELSQRYLTEIKEQIKEL